MSDNLAIDRLEDIAQRIERVMYGDMQARQPGLLDQVDSLRTDIMGVRKDVQELAAGLHLIQARRPNMWLWALGYVAFLVSGLFAMSAFYNLPEIQTLLSMPAPVAAGLAAVFALGAARLFVGGFGWLSDGEIGRAHV